MCEIRSNGSIRFVCATCIDPPGCCRRFPALDPFGISESPSLVIGDAVVIYIKA